MRRDAVPRVTRCGRPLRGLWPDRNPLRRAGPVEAVIMAGLLAAFLPGAPLAALAAGQSSAAGLRAEHAQQSAWHQVPAVLFANVPSQGYAG